MLTCSPLVGSVSSRDEGDAVNFSVISLFAIVPPVELRSISREIVSPAAMFVAPFSASVVGPVASLTVPEEIAWGPAVDPSALRRCRHWLARVGLLFLGTANYLG
jgi:hypothetical protein